MSYDVSIGDHSFNFTYNTAPLFYDHIPDYGNGGGLNEINGKTGKQAAVILSEAMERIDRTRCDYWKNGVVGEPVLCAKYDSPNGWGSTVGGILFLSRIMGACIQNPRSKVRVF